MDEELLAVGLLFGVGFLGFTETGAGVVRTVLPDFKPIDLGGVLGAKQAEQPAAKKEGDPEDGGYLGAVADIVGAVAGVATAGINVGGQLYSQQVALKAEKKAAKRTAATLNLRNDIARRAKRNYAAMSRGDVREWVIQDDGRIFIYFFQQGSTPLTLEPPGPGPLEPMKLALAFEPVVRVTGRAVQRGGRLVGKWVDFPDDPGFHPKNPYAPSHLRLDTLQRIRLQEEAEELARAGGQQQAHQQALATGEGSAGDDKFEGKLKALF